MSDAAAPSSPQPAGDDDLDLKALEELVKKVNGAAYIDDRLDTVVNTVLALRENPDLAARLLTGSSRS